MEIATEVYFAQQLASNEPKIREKTLKKLGRWFAHKSAHTDAFTEDSLLKVWKGLFYYFWHTDKPLVQEERADVITKYIHQFKSVETSFLYIDTFFQTMAREWLAIDRYRLEKFMMLVRRFLHETYQLLKRLNWKLKWIKQFRKAMKKSVASSDPETTPVGLKMHITDIYMEELAKVGADELTPEIVQHFLIPYCRMLVENDDLVFLRCVSKDVFQYLVNQDADEEIYQEFPVLKFDAEAIQNLLMKYASMPGVRPPNMKIMYGIIKKYENYKKGVSAVDRRLLDKRPVRRLRKRDIEKAALALLRDEQEYAEEKQRVKKKKIVEVDDGIIDL